MKETYTKQEVERFLEVLEAVLEGQTEIAQTSHELVQSGIVLGLRQATKAYKLHFGLESTSPMLMFLEDMFGAVPGKTWEEKNV